MQIEPVIEVLREGGPVMWALHGIAVVSLATVLDRSAYWIWACGAGILVGRSRRRRGRPTVPVHAPFARVADGDSPLVAARIAARQEVRKMNRNIGVLDLTVVIAPLLGILGTILGIAQAFSNGSESQLPAPAALAAGIGLAMRTTIWGLSISIVGAGFRFMFCGLSAKVCVTVRNTLERLEYECEQVGQRQCIST